MYRLYDIYMLGKIYTNKMQNYESNVYFSNYFFSNFSLFVLQRVNQFLGYSSLKQWLQLMK